jgi:hypothetical protein
VVYDATISGKPAKPVHVATPTATLTTDGILVKWVQLESETLLAGYRIYAGGVLVGATGKTNQYLYKQLTSATYSLTVVPVDAWGQEPTGSASAVSTTIGRPLNTRQVWIDGANIVWSFACGLGDLAAYKLPVAKGRIYFDVAEGEDYWDATNSPYLLPINPDWTDEYFYLDAIDIGGNVSTTRASYQFVLVPPNPDDLTAVADGKAVRLSWLQDTPRTVNPYAIGYRSEIRRGGTEWDDADIMGEVKAVPPLADYEDPQTPANFTVIEATTETKVYRVKMVDDVGHWSAEETVSITL